MWEHRGHDAACCKAKSTTAGQSFPQINSESSCSAVASARARDKGKPACRACRSCLYMPEFTSRRQWECRVVVAHCRARCGEPMDRDRFPVNRGRPAILPNHTQPILLPTGRLCACFGRCAVCYMAKHQSFPGLSCLCFLGSMHVSLGKWTNVIRLPGLMHIPVAAFRVLSGSCSFRRTMANHKPRPECFSGSGCNLPNIRKPQL